MYDYVYYLLEGLCLKLVVIIPHLEVSVLGILDDFGFWFRYLEMILLLLLFILLVTIPFIIIIIGYVGHPGTAGRVV